MLWAICDLSIHLTVVFTATVIEDGLKELLCINTSLASGVASFLQPENDRMRRNIASMAMGAKAGRLIDFFMTYIFAIQICKILAFLVREVSPSVSDREFIPLSAGIKGPRAQ